MLSGLPVATGLLIAAPRSAIVAERFGSKRVVVVGLVTVSVAPVLLSRLGPDTTYPYIGSVLFTLALEMGLTTAPTTTWIMTSLPLDKARVGSAVNDATRELGGALGVAVLGSMAAWRYRTVATAGDGQVSSSLGELLTAGQTAPQLIELARLAFVDGMSLAVLAAAAIALLAAAIVAARAPDDHPARPTHALPGAPTTSKPTTARASPDVPPHPGGAVRTAPHPP